MIDIDKINKVIYQEQDVNVYFFGFCRILNFCIVSFSLTLTPRVVYVHICTVYYSLPCCTTFLLRIIFVIIVLKSLVCIWSDGLDLHYNKLYEFISIVICTCFLYLMLLYNMWLSLIVKKILKHLQRKTNCK
jgi:hypothetical protein